MTSNFEKLFGWAFKREPIPEPVSFSPREVDDGAVLVAASGSFGTYIDLDGTVRSDAELVTRYREMAIHPEVDSAVDEIINEMIAGDEADTVKIILDDLKQSTAVKAALEDAFDEILQLLDFRHHGYDIVRKWYVDGRQYFHVIIDEVDPKSGIKELRYIDPRKIRKIREVAKVRAKGGSQGGMAASPALLTQVKNEYYLYSDRGFIAYGANPQTPSVNGIRIAKDAIVYNTSGLTDSLGTRVLSYLHKAIKPLNQLRILEDASVIYRLSRSPERRVWHVDIGNLPKMKAEQYVRDIMVKHKNRLNYDATTGEVRDDRKFQTILEDYWLPTRGDGKGTQVTVLPPGTSFNQIDDILFFQKKLYMSLHVPVNRLDPDNQYNEGAATGITRDEIKFGKLIARMRVRFSGLFIKLLEKQVGLKGIMTVEDFEKIAAYIRFDFVKNNYFMEMKDQQIMMSRLDLLDRMAPYVGRYFSNHQIRREYLKQDDEQIEEIDQEIEEEEQDPQYEGVPGQPPEMMDQGGVMVDPSQAEMPPPEFQKEPSPSQAAKGAKTAGGGTGGKTGGPSSFKSVAKTLSRNT